MPTAVIVGSGAGGSVAAMCFAEAGWHTVVLERGPDLYADLGAGLLRAGAAPAASGQSLTERGLPGDPDPRVFTHRGSACADYVGPVNALPMLVGGGTTHWDAKTPRFWDLDLAKRSRLGPVDDDAWVDDWPFGYAELEPDYAAVERLLGVQGSRAAMAGTPTLRHAPRATEFPMPPGPPQTGSAVLADAARGLGWAPFPAPMAANSVASDRPACAACGRCCGFVCDTGARGGAFVPLARAVRAGAELRPDSRVVAVRHRAGRAVGVEVRTGGGSYVEPADVVVLAASAVESVRLALLSRLPDPNGLVGRGVMFHSVLVATGAGAELPPGGRHYSHALDDFADPDFAGARAAARAAGLPYLRGGTVELGTSPLGLPAELLPDGADPARLLVSEMHGEDLAQPANRVRLAARTDAAGLPVAHVEYAAHRHEVAARAFYADRLHELYVAAGAAEVRVVPRGVAPPAGRLAARHVPSTHHVLGGLRMSADAFRAATGADGTLLGTPNVLVCDGAVFPTSGAHNPTLTIMAVALRTARHHSGWAG